MKFLSLVSIVLVTATQAAASTLPIDRNTLLATRDVAEAVKAPGAALGARQGVFDEVEYAKALASVEEILNDARKSASEEYRGRRTLESCTGLCGQCMDGALTSALGKIAACGTAALAVEVLTAGAATVLEVAGFIACQVITIGEYDEALANCKGLRT